MARKSVKPKRETRLMRVSCPICGAPGGVFCRDARRLRRKPHPEREQLVAKPKKLDAPKVLKKAMTKATPKGKRKLVVRSLRTVSGGGFETSRRRN